jgi:hypothetical protein
MCKMNYCRYTFRFQLTIEASAAHGISRIIYQMYFHNFFRTLRPVIKDPFFRSILMVSI